MSDLVAGVRYLGQGQRWIARHGRLFGFGLLPALISLVIYAAALLALGWQAGDVAVWATPFADGWSSFWQSSLRVVFAVLLFAGGLLLAVLTFTAVTLLIGDPFYESLSEQVEESEGGAPTAPDRPLWRELWTSLGDSLYVLVRALAFGIPLFVLGFVPFVGQSVIPAIGFAVAGFFLTLELSSVGMQRRGIPVRERLTMLRERKALALGFGVPLVLLFLVPFVAVLLMPGAVAGAALLVRDLAGTPDQGQRPPGDGAPRPAQTTSAPDGGFAAGPTGGHPPGPQGRTAFPSAAAPRPTDPRTGPPSGPPSGRPEHPEPDGWR